MTILTIESGFNTTMGAIMAVGFCLLVGGAIYGLAEYFKKEYKLYKSKPKFVLDNWDTYIAKGYFEELELLKKYKEQLKKGEWPDELDFMFEWKENGKGAMTDVFGDLYLYRKSFLTLKAKYKKSKVSNNSNNDNSNEEKSKQDDNNNEEQN